MFSELPTAGPSFDVVPPDAAALSESLRAFGYSAQAAVADIIDNSITADARRIRVHFEWAGGRSWAAISDDGHGMTADELVTAMRAGSRHPSDARGRRDLGRFGLGLKTASFSQCRRLTVCSRREGHAIAARCWDLDEISTSGEWRLLRALAPTTVALLEAWRPDASGTVVLWEMLDRIVDAATDREDDAAQQRFLLLVDDVVAHLQMVFHRFLGSGLHIEVNGQPLHAWDPFMTTHAATQAMPPEGLLLRGAVVQLRGYVVPHHSKLTQDEHARASGPRGWNDQQGFYVYREGRLLVAGSWLGLFRSEEHYKLARIAVDIPNSMDDAWAIDVRKSRATPPGPLRPALRAYAKLVRERAVEVYRFRGKVLARAASQDHVFAWERVLHRGRVDYRVSRRHPLVVATLRDPSAARVRALLHLLEETLPVAAIQIDGSEHPDSQSAPFEGVAQETLWSVMAEMYRVLRDTHTADEARRLMASMEAFAQRTDLIAALNDSLLSEGTA